MQGIGATKSWRLLGFVAILAAILSIAAIACSDDGGGDGGDATATEELTPSATEADETREPGVAGQLDITALEYSYKNVPSSIPGGLTTITLDNIGGEDHQAQFLKLNEGVTLDQLQTALEDPTGAQALAITTVGGGVNVIEPGTSGEVTHNLDEGSYVMLCFVSAADDVPHLAKGMITPFEVTAPAAEQPEPPTADVSITAADFAFTAPATIAAGTHTIEVTNSGPSPHEMTVDKLPEGMTFEDFQALLNAPEGAPTPATEPDLTAVGGIGAIPTNASAFTTLDLGAGTYVLLCFVPDDTGTPHAFLGMQGTFTVE